MYSRWKQLERNRNLAQKGWTLCPILLKQRRILIQINFSYLKKLSLIKENKVPSCK